MWQKLRASLTNGSSASATSTGFEDPKQTRTHTQHSARPLASDTRQSNRLASNLENSTSISSRTTASRCANSLLIVLLSLAISSCMALDALTIVYTF